MIKRFILLPFTIIAAILFVIARRLVSKPRNKPNFVVARIVVETACFFAHKLPYRFLILRGFIWHGAGKVECIKYLQEAWYLIEADVGLNDHERNYLKAYLYHSANFWRNTVHADIGFICEIDLDTIMLNKISSRWIREFPLRTHPDWSFD